MCSASSTTKKQGQPQALHTPASLPQASLADPHLCRLVAFSLSSLTLASSLSLSLPAISPSWVARCKDRKWRECGRQHAAHTPDSSEAGCAGSGLAFVAFL